MTIDINVLYASSKRRIAELEQELSDYKYAATAEAQEVDRRGKHIKELKAENEWLKDTLRWVVNRAARYP